MAGLKEDDKPFISAFDLIGAPVITDDFVVGGTCTNNLYGMCESLYRPNMVSRSESGEEMYALDVLWDTNTTIEALMNCTRSSVYLRVEKIKCASRSRSQRAGLYTVLETVL